MPAIPVVVIGGAFWLLLLGRPRAGGCEHSDYAKGIYGTAMATMGMFSPPDISSQWTRSGRSPITQAASWKCLISHPVHERIDKLDSVGNTTKALTKGYAIGSAALAAFLLFSAYIETVKASWRNFAIHQVQDPGAFPTSTWSGSGFCRSVAGRDVDFPVLFLRHQGCGPIGSIHQKMYGAVPRQSRHYGRHVRAGYGRCVRIVTGSALKQMVLPGALAVLTPLAVGLVFRNLSGSFHIHIPGEYSPVPNGRSIDLAGAEAVAALLMVGTIVGILMAMLMNNSGGAWDNAKKYIETGAHGGKRSEAHKAAVVGDTVGDPFKDTAGPSLHVLIKLLATVTLVLAPLFL